MTCSAKIIWVPVLHSASRSIKKTSLGIQCWELQYCAKVFSHSRFFTFNKENGHNRVCMFFRWLWTLTGKTVSVHSHLKNDSPDLLQSYWQWSEPKIKKFGFNHPIRPIVALQTTLTDCYRTFSSVSSYVTWTISTSSPSFPSLWMVWQPSFDWDHFWWDLSEQHIDQLKDEMHLFRYCARCLLILPPPPMS